MKIKKIIQDLPLKVFGDTQLEITGLCSHSSRVVPGNLFIAKAKDPEKNEKNIQEALAAGARAILTDLYNPFLEGVTQLVESDVIFMESLLVERFYHAPSKKLNILAVTGTNGKTTTTFILRHLLNALNNSCGLIGTIEYDTGLHRINATLTTPDVVELNKMMVEMNRAKMKSCVMEASSHALDQDRLKGIDIDMGIFTNLSQDHLDYHHSMDAYARAKKKLFLDLGAEKIAIINRDDAFFDFMSSGIKCRVKSYGIEKDADYRIKDLVVTNQGIEFTYVEGEMQFAMRSNLLGNFNAYNLLAAISALRVMGYSIEEIEKHLIHIPHVPGRLEKLELEAPFEVIIDFAHTPEAIEMSLKTVGRFKQGKLILVFGCGGNRDEGKRVLMGEMADRYADYSIITSDNPRKEDPKKICQEVAKGFKSSSHYQVIVDRKDAIEKALEIASEGDIILIAGRGHEEFQTLSTGCVPFKDRDVTLSLYNNRSLIG